MAATYSINGVPADSPGAWKLKKGTTWRSGIGTRVTDIQIPGWHGSIPTQWDTLETATTQFMWHVYGSEDDPGLLMRNVDQLRALLSWGRQQVMLTRSGAGLVDGTQTASARIKAVGEPDVLTPGSLAALTMTCELPGVFWRGASADWVGPSGVGWQAVITTLTGSTAPIGDAIFLLNGPVTGARIGLYPGTEDVLLDTTIAAGEQLRLDAATWTAVRGTDIGFTGAGTDASAVISPSVDLGPALTLAPSSNDVRVTLTGTGGNANTKMQIRARGAYL